MNNMFNIILFEPEIPPNTGNIIRLCANTGSALHLIEPLGFSLDDKRMRRAGLDYHELTHLTVHPSLAACLTQVKPKRVFACSTQGQTAYHQVKYEAQDAFIFGPETRGLDKNYLNSLKKDQILRIPMRAQSRSLNLSNAVAVILFEALRQHNFENA